MNVAEADTASSGITQIPTIASRVAELITTKLRTIAGSNGHLNNQRGRARARARER